MMSINDSSAKLESITSSPTINENSTNPDASHQLRGKILGVLIRDARIAASRTIHDCAQRLHITPETFEAWEYGDEAPSLPHLELLAYYLNIPVSHFWSETLRSQAAQNTSIEDEYIALRNRMIGALLRSARKSHNISIEDLSATTKINAQLIRQYEYGELATPMNQLTVIAEALNQPVDYFLERHSYIGELLAMYAEWQKFMDLDDDMRQFTLDETNAHFIKLAMLFSTIQRDTLHDIAEGILDITD
jgi:transcriptional regulator with XRE-family HTH domain